MPSRSNTCAACIPSQVAAILMSTRFCVSMPCAWYNWVMRRARTRVASVSKLKRASTSVDTRPGSKDKISQPKRTSKRSMFSS